MGLKPFDELGLQRIECHLAGDVCHARHEVVQLWCQEGGGGGCIAGGVAVEVVSASGVCVWNRQMFCHRFVCYSLIFLQVLIFVQDLVLTNIK